MYNFKKAAGFIAAVSITLLLPFTAQAGSYTVVKGDSLYTIGKLFNTTSSTIMEENKLSSQVIYPGQVLNVPSVAYTVKSGDSLYLIAKRNGVSLDSLRKANNKWDDSIYIGQKLILPGVNSSQGQSTNSSSLASRGNTSAGVISYSSSDLDLLARLITAETDGQPYDAAVGVGAVVINRIKDSRFPASLSTVIYQKDNGYYQFTPVQNGWINKPATAEAKKAAYDALHGSDPSKGAVFYFDDSATNKWLWSKPIKARIGNMVFVY